jgi:uncharacterized coiled-coil DUF342 family protein
MLVVRLSANGSGEIKNELRLEKRRNIPMTMRKPTYSQRIAELKAEIETVEKFMDPAVKEAETLDAVAKTRVLNPTERKRVQELIDYIHAKNVWLIKAKEELKAYYMPVSA